MVQFRAASLLVTLILLFKYCNTQVKEINTAPLVLYGVHQVHACPEFEKAYLCIQKCLDLRFDVASADKKCKCTCRHKKSLAKYTLKRSYNTTNWKLGAPTTALPLWLKHLIQADEDAPQSGEETSNGPQTSKDHYHSDE